MSHAAGVGPALPRDVVRAMLLLRANTLALGHSGCRPALGDNGYPRQLDASANERAAALAFGRVRFHQERHGACLGDGGNRAAKGQNHSDTCTAGSVADVTWPRSR